MVISIVLHANEKKVFEGRQIEDRIKYTLLFYMPELYRLWKDHTMLDYERNLKSQWDKEKIFESGCNIEKT